MLKLNHLQRCQLPRIFLANHLPAPSSIYKSKAQRNFS
jgi:hypothetical protein